LKKCYYILLILFTVLFIGTSYGQKENPYKHLEIIPDIEEATDFEGSMRVNSETGVPVAIYYVNFKAERASPEHMASEYLQKNFLNLKLSRKLDDLKHSSTRETPAGYHVRFQQYYQGYPVYESTIVVNISRENMVYFVMNGYKTADNKNDVKFNSVILVSENEALAAAKNYLNIRGSISAEEVETVVFYNQGSFRLAQKVSIVPSEELFGDWEIMVDASSGEIFRVVNKACYGHNHNPGSDRLVNGSGWVFAPNPITRARTSYGQPGFIDNNDADSDSLTAQLMQVVLKDLTYTSSTGKYTLKNNWAEIMDFEAPYTGLHQLDSSNFHFKRADDNFEAVNTFYALATMMEWINDSLGINLRPYQYPGGVRFDPHALNGDDNSYYSTTTGRVAFGDGGVDDAEDPFVIIHELGHGLHDWATNGGLSQVQGLSEGCGDYLGMSYERSYGCLTPDHPAYNYAFNWDGHNPFWAGRITNYAPLYPGGLIGQIHTDGQMWSSSLMSIYDQIGRKATDKNFFTALAMLNSASNQRDAALAFMQADQLNYGGAHSSVIGSVFVARGYITGPVTADFTANITGGQAPLAVQFTDLSTTTSTITSWQWDFNNDGVIDATVKNPSWTFTAPGIYTVSLTVSDGTNFNTKTKTNYISVNSGVFVWEGKPNEVNYSGTFIKNFLQTNNYEVSYSTTLPSSLLGYNGVFLSFGNYGSGGTSRTQFTAEMAAIVKSYLDAGGKVYLEGGDALGWDQRLNTALLNLFGISGTEDGVSAQTPITTLTGKPGTVTEGMLFTGSTQLQNTYIDKFTAGGTGLIAFTMGTYGNVAVQNSGTAGHKTFAFSYALAHLNDASLPSTRENLLINLLNFFNVYPIPVELTSFTASVSSGSVILKWETATETNNSGFYIERRKAGNEHNYISLDFIEGKGTTTEKSSYSYIDNPVEGKYIYRLKQTDLDGTISYSNETEADLSIPVYYSLEQNYPNPFNPSTSIQYSIENDGFVSLIIYNSLGEKVATLVNTTVNRGKYEVLFDASGLTSGIYFYRLETTNFTSVKKMVVTK
jgi:PKD repeat protein